MKQKIKEKWVEALRSSSYTQIKGALHSDYGFDCLGVLCDIYAKEENKEWIKLDDEYSVFSFERETGVIPDEVKYWSGLFSNNPSLVKDGKPELISVLNDTGLSFEEIAELIEDQL